MIKKLFILLMILLFTGTLATAKSTFWKDQIQGSYIGKVYSGGKIETVQTDFTLKDGIIVGRYTIFEAAGPSMGTLHHMQRTGHNRYLFQWTDEYGNGVVRMTFDSNHTRFKGEWRTMDVTDGYFWSGQKK